MEEGDIRRPRIIRIRSFFKAFSRSSLKPQGPCSGRDMLSGRRAWPLRLYVPSWGGL